MNTNPFTSLQFETTWSKHFNKGDDLMSFDFINKLKFIKNSSFGVYENAGRNLTKGIFYDLDHSKEDYKGKTFLIYDVPDYFKVDAFNPPQNSSLKLKKVFQYQGFLMDISSYKDQDEYINAQFSSKNRREFRSNQRRLEECFDIDYSFLHGELSRPKFEAVFDEFYTLLNKRFAGKEVNYHHLSSEKWNYYKELVYIMLQEKKASLLLINRDETPIGVTLNFHSEDILFETITVFDPDYYKFSVGKTSIIKLLEWCFENNYRISDFSKGDFDYKHKWSNLVYDFNYHILYDSKSIPSTIKANFLEIFYKTKLYLRRKKVNELYRKVRFMLQGNKKESYETPIAIKFDNIDDFKASKDYELVDYKLDANDFLKQYVYTFAFANPEVIDHIKVYQSIQNKKVYLISGSKKTQQITFS